MRRHIFILFSIILLSSCLSRPDYVLDEDKMIEVLCDVHRSEGLLEMQQMQSTITYNEDYKKNVMAAVLVKNGITRAQYDSSLVWYGQNLKYLVKVYGKVQKQLDEDIKYWENYDLLSKSEFPTSDAGDSVQIWTIKNYYALDESRLSSTKFWEIPTDSNYIAGDKLHLHFNIPTIPKSHYVVASLSLNYEPKEEEYLEPTFDYKLIKNPSSVDLFCQADSTREFKSIIAAFSLIKDSIAVSDEILFVDSLSLIRIHK